MKDELIEKYIEFQEITPVDDWADPRSIAALIALVLTLLAIFTPFKKLSYDKFDNFINKKNNHLKQLHSAIVDKSVIDSADPEPEYITISTDEQKITEILADTIRASKSITFFIKSVIALWIALNTTIVLSHLFIKLNSVTYQFPPVQNIAQSLYNAAYGFITLNNAPWGVLYAFLIIISIIILMTYFLHLKVSDSYKEMNTIIVARSLQKSREALQLLKVNCSTEPTIDCEKSCVNYEKITPSLH